MQLSQVTSPMSQVTTNRTKTQSLKQHNLCLVTQNTQYQCSAKDVGVALHRHRNSFKQSHDSHHSIEVLYVVHGLLPTTRALEGGRAATQTRVARPRHTADPGPTAFDSTLEETHVDRLVRRDPRNALVQAPIISSGASSAQTFIMSKLERPLRQRVTAYKTLPGCACMNPCTEVYNATRTGHPRVKRCGRR